MKIFKTFFVLVLSIACLLSCSKNDDAGNIEIPSDEKLLGSIDGSGGLNFNATVSYNPDKTVRRLNYESALLFDFDYLDNRISAIEVSANGQIRQYACAYDGQGHLASFSVGEVLTPLDHNPLTNSYQYINQNNQEITITLTQDGDVRQYLADDIDDNGTSSIVMTYADDKKGGISNSNLMALHLWLIIDNPAAVFYVFPFSKRPLEIASIADGGVIVFENIYDSQDFISSVSIVGPNVEANSSTFNYIALD